MPESIVIKNENIKNKNNRKKRGKYRNGFENFIYHAKEFGDFIYTFALLGFGIGGLIGVSIGVIMVKVLHNCP